MRADKIVNHQRQAKDRFDAWSRSHTFKMLEPWLAFVQSNVLNRIDWSSTARFLDVGCGSGVAVVEAANRISRVGRRGGAFGCDLSPGMLRKRQPANGTMSHFVAASAQALPYSTSTFDVVICTAAFHHFPAPEEALLEIRRVLRSGGQLIIAETCRDQAFGTWVFDQLHRWFEKGHVKYYRIDEILPLLHRSGFTNVLWSELEPNFSEVKKLVRKVALFQATSAK